MVARCRNMLHSIPQLRDAVAQCRENQVRFLSVVGVFLEGGAHLGDNQRPAIVKMWSQLIGKENSGRSTHQGI